MPRLFQFHTKDGACLTFAAGKPEDVMEMEVEAKVLLPHLNIVKGALSVLL